MLLVGAVVTPTDSTQHTDRQANRHGKGVFIVDLYHSFCGRARFVLCENVSSIVYGRRTGVLLYYGLCCAPYRGIDTTRIGSPCLG